MPAERRGAEGWRQEVLPRGKKRRLSPLGLQQPTTLPLLWVACFLAFAPLRCDSASANIVWILAPEGGDCDSACNAEKLVCLEEALAGIDSRAEIEEVANASGHPCDGVAGWGYDNNPGICTNPKCCGDGGCTGICAYGNTGVRSCAGAAPGDYSRLCPCLAEQQGGTTAPSVAGPRVTLFEGSSFDGQSWSLVGSGDFCHGSGDFTGNATGSVSVEGGMAILYSTCPTYGDDVCGTGDFCATHGGGSSPRSVLYPGFYSGEELGIPARSLSYVQIIEVNTSLYWGFRGGLHREHLPTQPHLPVGAAHTPSADDDHDGNSSSSECCGGRGVLAFEVDELGGKAYFAEPRNFSDPWEANHSTEQKGFAIRRSNIDGSQLEDLVTEDLRKVSDLALDMVGRRLFWADGRRIFGAQLDGTKVEVIYESLSADIQGIAVDSFDHEIYWTDRMAGSISKMSLDGSRVPRIIVNRTSPRNIVVSRLAHKVFWTDSNMSRVYSASLEGKDRREIIVANGGDYGASVTGLAVDASWGRIVWPDPVTKTMWASDLDGGKPVALLKADQGPEDWLTLYSTGSFGDFRPSGDEFNEMVRGSRGNIIRRECSGCNPTHQDIYMRRNDMDTYNAYQDLLVTWRGDVGFQQTFNLFSSLDDALSRKDPWQSCNGNDPGVGFPRDCGPQQGLAYHDQWNSLQLGSREYRFSLLVGRRKEAVPVVMASFHCLGNICWDPRGQGDP